MRKEIYRFLFAVMCFFVMMCVGNNRNVFAATSGTDGSCSWVIDDDGVLTISPTDGVSGTLGYASTSDNGPCYSYRSQIKKVVVNPGVKAGTSCFRLFYKFSKCTEMRLSNLDTSNVTSMREMFTSCRSLTSLDVSRFDTSKVTNMGSMFNGCSGLTSLDVSRFDTSNVTNMYSMFNSCNGLTSLDVSKFDTGKVTTMEAMFSGCSGLINLDVSGFDTSKVTTMYLMFYNCKGLSSLDVSGFNTSNVMTMESMLLSGKLDDASSSSLFQAELHRGGACAAHCLM